MSKHKFAIQMILNDASMPVYQVSGVIDESADLSPLSQAQGPQLYLDLGGIRRINSFGVRTWMETMRQIPEGVQVIFARCAPPVIDQCNMVVGFRARADIVSFQVPLICEDCDEQRIVLFDTAQCLALGATLPVTPCPECDEPMEIDDLEEHYLHFLHEDLEHQRS